MAEYERKTIKMNPVGMSLAYEPDNMPEGLFPLLYNTKFTKDGNISVRDEIKSVKSLSAIALSDTTYLIKRLTYAANDYRLIHYGSRLVLHNLVTDALSVLDTGFSNSPNTTSIVSIRPEESIIPYLYISNSNVFKKLSSEGDYVGVGITAPNSPPVVKIAAPAESVIDSITGAGYTAGGAAGALATVNRVPNTTTLTKLLFDSGSSGWASIVVNTFPSALQARTVITVADATIPVTEDVLVEEVLPAYIAIGVATITSIQYDSGVSGDATVQLSIPPENLKENAILLLGGTEYVRVKAVINSVSQGKNAIRITTIGTFSAGATVSGVASFRAYLQNGTYTVTNTTFSTDAMKIPFAAAGTGYASKTVAIDLSRIGNRPISDDDILRFSVLATDTTRLEEGQVQLDLSQTGGNFENYIFYAFNPSSLTQSYKQLGATTLSQQQLLQRAQLRREYINSRIGRYERGGPQYAFIGDDFYVDGVPDYTFDIDPIAVPNELNLGDFQWTVFEVPLKQILANRVGSDASRSLKDITALRFSFRVSGAVDIYVDSVSIGGTYALDSSLNNEEALNGYYWVYRYRSSKTRAISSFSPPNRDSKFITRGRADLTFAVSADAQVDKIDIFRFGGRLTQFYYVGTAANTTASFFDELADNLAIRNPVADFTLYEPFAILDKSKTGVCNVIGTEVTRVSGDNFDVAWARGSQIIIDGVSNSLYNSPTSTTRLTLEKSVGNLSNVSFYLPSPLLVGQTLPTIFGPFGQGNFGLIVFGLGNPNAKGTVYWLNGNNPDVMRDINYLEITGPDEPLIDGCIFRNIPYVFTNKRGFILRASLTSEGLAFIAEEIEGVRGVRAKGCLTVSNAIYFISWDGVYSFDGGSVRNISYDIHPLFPTRSIPASSLTIGNISQSYKTFNGLNSSQYGQIVVHKGFLYIFFSQMMLGNVPGIFVYDLLKEKYVSIYEVSGGFTITSISSDEVQYDDELMLGGNGTYYEFVTPGTGGEAGFSNRINPAPSVVTPFYDLGDGRILKEFAEFTIDTKTTYTTNGITPTIIGIQPIVYFDNFDIFKVPTPPGVVSANINDTKRKKTLLEFPNLEVVQAKNVGFWLELNNEASVVYEAQFSYLVKREKIRHRYTDWNRGEFGGTKILKELIVEADTFGATVNLEVQGDGGVVITTIPINHTGQKRVAYSIPDNYTIMFRVREQAAGIVDWILYDIDVRYEQAPDSVNPPTKFEDGGYLGLKYLQRIIIDADTSGQDVSVDIESGTGNIVVSDIIINHAGRQVKTYDFDPVTGYIFRLLFDSNARIFSVQYKFDVEPEGQAIWQTQPTTHDIPGYQIATEALLAFRASEDVTFRMTIDGVNYDYNIGNTNGRYEKVLVSLRAVKGKLFEYRLFSEEAFPIAKKDCEIRVLSINGGGTQIRNPFGHLSREIGTA